MKIGILIIFSLFIFKQGFSQENEAQKFHYYVNIADVSSLIIKQKNDGFFSIISKYDNTETSIYEKYKISTFNIAYPNTDKKLFKDVYHISTDDKNLLIELQEKYPKKYTRLLEFFPAPNPYYPNDYGNTSPVKNLGNPYSSRDLDIINAPGAWSISKGDKKVIIGISDSRIDTLNIDMKGKLIKDLHPDNPAKASDCSHGTNVAGIAFARMDNAFGRPGICSECGGISTRYGSFKYIEDLVDAGAKVINTSWAMCGMGSQQEIINKRISEYYEDGIIIVAAAGNGRDCNFDKTSIGDLMYPASFDKVISVTGVFSEYPLIEDGYFTKDNINYTHEISDRRSGYFIIDENGVLNPTPIEKGVQVNTAVDLLAPRQGYLLGHEVCGKDEFFGGASSSSAPYVTGTIGLMWSANYCLSSYEIETILKLTAADVENLKGNTLFKGMLGAGRLDAYKAVKMANDMKNLNGNIIIKDREFYRFDFKIERAQHNITIQNQTFREDASVDFKARNAIILKPNTHLKPNATGKIKLAIDPNISNKECEPQPPKKYDRIFK